MTIVTTSEAQASLGQLIASIAQGEEVLITEGGLPVAQLVRPTIGIAAFARAGVQAAAAPEADEDEERPWRGVLAIDSPGDPYPCGKLHLSTGLPQQAEQPVDILWDRMTHNDD
jgi:antitoxin (DNA-binding transcriptional repressor) of toxin-antitoxin stability system